MITASEKRIIRNYINTNGGHREKIVMRNSPHYNLKINDGFYRVIEVVAKIKGKRHSFEFEINSRRITG